jgi:hypothetical protein
VINSDGVRLGEQAARDLARTGCCEIGPGLTEAEFARIEREYGFEFADDHRAFLEMGLPLNGPLPQTEGVIYTHAKPWPDWRDDDPRKLREALNWPVEGVLFDVEHGYWDHDWGERPEDRAEAVEAAAVLLAAVPRMVPIYGHRYLPAGHGSYGHPVLSMWQTDIIYYGSDLVDYIHHEFGTPDPGPDDSRPNPRATVPFWRDFV